MMIWFMGGKLKCVVLALAAVLSLTLIAGCGSNQAGSSSALHSSESASEASTSSASTDNKDDIRIKVVDSTKDFVNGGDNAMAMYETEDGVVLYDLDIDKDAVTDGQSASYVEDGDSGLDYILENGYPNKTYTNNKGMDAYITQMAIWWYVNEDALSSDFRNAAANEDEYGLVERARKLVDGARSAASAGEASSARIFATGNSNTTRVVGLFE